MESLKDYLHTMRSCNHCGQCKWVLGPKMRGWRYSEVCPIHQRFHFDAYSGQGLINIAQEMLEGRLKYEDGLLRLIYTCLTCGACDVNCKSIRDMEVLDTILALRAKCVEDGQGPLPEHREIAAKIETCHNIYGKPNAHRFNWLPPGTNLSKTSSIAYFAGCASSYKHPQIAVNTVNLLIAAGIEFKVLAENEHCCGISLWRTGQIPAFQKIVEHNLDIFKKQGIKTIITSCAECFGTFRAGYPRFTAMDIEVLHISQVAQQALKEGRLKPQRKLDLKVTYHDPCFLGRLSEKYVPWQGEIQAFGLHVPPKQWRRGTYGVYDPPREILSSIPGIELVEMPRNAENAFCCGAGMGVSAAYPDFASWVAAERLDEAKSIKASALVSACPFCQESFEGAIKTTHSPLSYYDLTELLVQVI
jgi:Fe-S oxidoreductase